MKRFEFYLRISSEKYLDYYRGTTKQVVVRSVDGLDIQFPASLLTRFVTTSGIQGHFSLTCDDGNKGAVLQRISAG